MRIELAFGKANLSNQLATYGAMRIQAPFKRESAVNTGKSVPGTRQRTPVGPLEAYGGFVSDKVEHPDGTIIMLTLSWKGRMGMNVREGALFLRLRQGAPLWNIIAKVPTGPQSRMGDEQTVFSGFADLLRPDELKLFGIEVPRQYVTRYCNPEELKECFRLVQLQKESAARPTVALIDTPEGPQTREIAVQPARRMRLSRRM